MSSESAASAERQPNRLIDATSPYLLQHAYNPVDWHEWGPAALDKARAADKPIFLSIGYSACHWCHVMAHESFENEAIATVMNDCFVNIKVDREERPDLDELYMRATVIYTRGHGGWPMSVWLTPALEPFAAGTYFPPTSRYGRPGFAEVCRAVEQAWRDRRDEIEKSAAQLSEYLSTSMVVSGDDDAQALTLDSVDRAALMIAGAFDVTHGGLSGGGTNKFPPSMAIGLLLRVAERHRDNAAVRDRLVGPVNVTLAKMARGGIRDHLGGGFARYSTDVTWHVPHFEKMLYDQALVSGAYLDGYQFTGKACYAEVAREIFDYVLGDLQSPEGGFYSARDADSEGVEGKFYVWTRDEVLAALGEEDGALFCDYYDVRTGGNWDDPHAPGEPKNVLRIVADAAALAAEHGLSAEQLHARLATCRETLRQRRAERTPPSRDEKVLCEWNGLMIASFARGGAVLDAPEYVRAAQRAADFILREQCTNGRLKRAWRAGRATETAFLTDYAALIEGLLNLYEATFDQRWIAAALDLNAALEAHFWDEAAGGYFFTPADHETLIARSKEVNDNATPSGNSVQLMNLLRLALLTGETRLHDQADHMLKLFSAPLLENAGAGERFLAGVDFALGQPLEVLLIGPRDTAAMQALLGAVRATYLPRGLVLLFDPDEPKTQINSPLLEGRGTVDGQPTAYVCHGTVCLPPVTNVTELNAHLGQG